MKIIAKYNLKFLCPHFKMYVCFVSVRFILLNIEVTCQKHNVVSLRSILLIVIWTLNYLDQEIDAILAGGLTQEDEDDVLRELDEITKVCILLSKF